MQRARLVLTPLIPVLAPASNIDHRRGGGEGGGWRREGEGGAYHSACLGRCAIPSHREHVLVVVVGWESSSHLPMPWRLQWRRHPAIYLIICLSIGNPSRGRKMGGREREEEGGGGGGEGEGGRCQAKVIAHIAQFSRAQDDNGKGAYPSIQRSASGLRLSSHESHPCSRAQPSASRPRTSQNAPCMYARIDRTGF